MTEFQKGQGLPKMDTDDCNGRPKANKYQNRIIQESKIKRQYYEHRKSLEPTPECSSEF